MTTNDFQKYSGFAPCINGDGNDAFCRGLCSKCYQYARRHNELDLYPSREVLKNTDDIVAQLFENFPERIADMAISYGYRLVRLEA